MITLFRASVTINNLAGEYIEEPLVGNLINQLITHIILYPNKEILKEKKIVQAKSLSVPFREAHFEHQPPYFGQARMTKSSGSYFLEAC